MRIEQYVVVKFMEHWKEQGDVYEEDGVDMLSDSDGISTAEEGFLRGYLDAVPV